MEHLLLKAAATATDRGEFTAIAAAYTVDRVKDRIVPGAFKNTIERWRQSGKRIPLHWNHQGSAESIIGSIDPAKMRETADGLYVEGKLDLADSEVAKEAWRSMKNGSMSLSFGYAVDKARKAAGGITELLEIDLFEVSIVPAPANADTRVLSVKSLVADEVFAEHELEAAVSGDLKAVWTTAYVNALPDSAFLFIEDGGEKDAEGKTTPRTLRHFPYMDAGGNVDLPHLRNALSRIPQAQFLSQAQKDRLAEEARRVLDNQKSAVEDAKDKDREAGKSRAQDPLRKRADAIELEFLSDGVTPRKSPPKPAPPKPELVPLAELKRRMRDEMLIALSGEDVET